MMKTVPILCHYESTKYHSSVLFLVLIRAVYLVRRLLSVICDRQWLCVSSHLGLACLLH